MCLPNPRCRRGEVHKAKNNGRGELFFGKLFGKALTEPGLSLGSFAMGCGGIYTSAAEWQFRDENYSTDRSFARSFLAVRFRETRSMSSNFEVSSMSDLSVASWKENWETRLLAARGGSLPDIGELLEHCRDYLLLIANAEVPSELRPKVGASDLVQQSLAEACQAFPQFQGANEFNARLATVHPAQ